MRTTVTLDAEVERLIRREMAAGRKSFKEVLNEAVRRGLQGQMEEPATPFEVRARPMRLRAGIAPARIRDFDDELEIREYVRITRALAEDDR